MHELITLFPSARVSVSYRPTLTLCIQSHNHLSPSRSYFKSRSHSTNHRAAVLIPPHAERVRHVLAPSVHLAVDVLGQRGRARVCASRQRLCGHHADGARRKLHRLAADQVQDRLLGRCNGAGAHGPRRFRIVSRGSVHRARAAGRRHERAAARECRSEFGRRRCIHARRGHIHVLRLRVDRRPAAVRRRRAGRVRHEW